MNKSIDYMNLADLKDELTNDFIDFIIEDMGKEKIYARNINIYEESVVVDYIYITVKRLSGVSIYKMNKAFGGYYKMFIPNNLLTLIKITNYRGD